MEAFPKIMLCGIAICVVIIIAYINLSGAYLRRLQSEARPLEIKYLMGEKLTKDEAERLVKIHEELQRVRGR
jgi:hypothetical protein